MHDYCLDIGNSSAGQIGLCAYTSADNKAQALEQLRAELGDSIEVKAGEYYQTVYLNWDAISVKDISRA